MIPTIDLARHCAADVLALPLEPLGPREGATSGTPMTAGVELWKEGGVEAGVWECTPGAFPSVRDGYAEWMHFVAGAGTITDTDGAVFEIRPGSVRYFPDGWRGTWEITQTVRKTYVMVDTVR